LLLPLLKDTVAEYKTDARIVVTSSSLHLICRSLDLDLLTSPVRTKAASYDGVWRYARSKLGNILYAKELSRRLLSDSDSRSHQIYVNAYFPGNIATEQMDGWKEYFGVCGAWSIKKFFSVAGQSTEDGAATAVYLATSKEIAEGQGVRGQYFIPIAKKDTTSSIANDMKLAQQLWVSGNRLPSIFASFISSQSPKAHFHPWRYQDWIDSRVTEALGDGWQSAGDSSPVDIENQ
jgi:NAD(P)-dependent dehydrogenase (short-subunit alcohol dehydrogenase family)